MATTTKKTEVVEGYNEAPTKGGHWDEMVEVKLPKKNDGSNNCEIVSVNGRTFKVMRGVKVSVPRPIASVLQNSFDAEEEAEAFIEGLLNK